MTRAEFKINVKQATDSIYEVSNEELELIVETLYNPNETWYFDDFYELARCINDAYVDVPYALQQYS